MATLLNVLIFVFVLGLVVLVHEFGHFIFARRAGILCHEFSIGMGPAVYKIKRGETTYAIRAIPIGGYVSMAGEEPETSKIKKDQIIYLDTKDKLIRKIYLFNPKYITATKAKVIDFDLYGQNGDKLYIHYEDEDGQSQIDRVKRDAMYVFDEKTEYQIAPYDRCFESKPWIPRFLTVVMGAGFNFLLAILIFIIVNLLSGVPTDLPIVDTPLVNSPSEGKLLEDDEIVSINGVDINKWEDVTSFMANYAKSTNDNKALTVVVLRDGKEVTEVMTPMIYIATLGLYSDHNNVNSNIVGTIGKSTSAYIEGLREGDVITRIKGTRSDDKNTENVSEIKLIDEPVSNFYEIREVLQNFYLNEEIEITYSRNGVEDTIKVALLKALEPENVSAFKLGISPITEFRPLKSIVLGVTNTFGVIDSVFQTLGLLFNNKNVGVSDLSGPLGIYQMTKTFAMAGLISLLSWIAFISANIGFVNLLPIPALDGGRLIFLVIEKIARRPISRKVEGYIHTVGFVLFMLLFVYVFYNDLLRMF
ncbi:MAG: rasP [Haloplasmataceae bacterium]|jgi:regulator of sigma E protease|nr:rasP [Haloplasmataceae bacterium]